jgi:lysophospholipase L1-like esterase
MPPTAYAPDLITIMAGTNDHGFNTTIGAITDTPATSGSFYAVYKQLIETLITNYPNASIGLITPIQRNGSTNGNNANAVGKTLRDYCDAVVALGKNYSLPVLDWYYSLGFSPYNTTQLNNFYCGSPSDGTHPNDKGHTIMAGKVGNFIESL